MALPGDLRGRMVGAEGEVPGERVRVLVTSALQIGHVQHPRQACGR
jgi:hypothetical protein